MRRGILPAVPVPSCVLRLYGLVSEVWVRLLPVALGRAVATGPARAAAPKS